MALDGLEDSRCTNIIDIRPPNDCKTVPHYGVAKTWNRRPASKYNRKQSCVDGVLAAAIVPRNMLDYDSIANEVQVGVSYR